MVQAICCLWCYRVDKSAAIRCLAFLSVINEQFWNQFVDDDRIQHLKYILHTAFALSKLATQLMVNHVKITEVATTDGQSQGRYLGFDERDVADFHMEGYADVKALEEERREQFKTREQDILVVLLLLTQLFGQSSEDLSVSIENDRDRARETAGDSRLAITQLTEPIHNRPRRAIPWKSCSQETQSVGSWTTAVSGAPPPPPPPPRVSGDFDDAWKNCIVDYTQEYVEYQNVLPHLLQIVQDMLDLSNTIFDGGFQQCLKAILSLNAQFPMIEQVTTEVCDCFPLECPKQICV
jgi:hypothetical protein